MMYLGLQKYFYIIIMFYFILLKVNSKLMCIITISVNLEAVSIDLFIHSLANTNYSGILIIFSDKSIPIKR